MKNSITILFKQIDKVMEGPEAWEQMIIKSIYKGKESKKKMENRRGLFITSVIGKLFEKVKLIDQRTIIEGKISKFQTGGIKGKSTADNIMTLNAIID